ncbi:MAG TPA: zinc-binding dehydrogenase [Verrucomicrobiae bacterium]|nr:zinc-binding dehydrogenase [Verrucomicrobiae bacterium]
MKAVRLTAHGAPGKLEFGDVPEPQPGREEVQVRVKACGLNHLDLWMEKGELPIRIDLPRIQGCEIAGEVSEVGPEVSGWKSGDRVAVQSNIFCGKCEYCTRGEESMCLANIMLGVQIDGGFAEKVVVPERALAKLPDNVDFQTSAALTLAGSTAMHMLMDRTQVRRGDWVLVIAGASGVGSAAIQIARQTGARVISTGSSKQKQDLAAKLGAEAVLDSNDANWAAEVRKLTQKRGVDVVIEHVGGQMLTNALSCLARGGTVVTCGATAGANISLDIWPLFVKQQRLVGSYGRNRADFVKTLEWAASGKLRPVIHTVLPLEGTRDAFALMRERKVLGKVIVVPG